MKVIVRDANAAASEAAALMLIDEEREARAADITTVASGFKPRRRRSAGAAPHLAALTRFAASDFSDVPPDKVPDAITRMERGSQVDRKGNRRPTKTDGSARTVPIPRELAVLLVRHKLAARDTDPETFVFATRTGRPLGQRNVERALRQAERDATDRNGRPTFPILHE